MCILMICLALIHKLSEAVVMYDTLQVGSNCQLALLADF